MFYHASSVPHLTVLEPRISNHGASAVYFSVKRENVLVYLSNAIEKYCRETGFAYGGVWEKWASYGFTGEGLLRFEEYYENALVDTYKGVSGYIYSCETLVNEKRLSDIPYAVMTDKPAVITGCEFIPDALAAIEQAELEGSIKILRYQQRSPAMAAWIEKAVRKEYLDAKEHPEYRHFLLGKFPYLAH